MEKEMTTIFRSKKFVLRHVRSSDAQSIVEHINNRKIFRNTLHIPYPYAVTDARAWLRRTLSMYRKQRPVNFNLAIVVNDIMIGSVGLNHIEYGHKAEIGYWLAEPYWGQGIMSEAVGTITAYGFKHFKLKRIYAYVFLYNRPSHQVLKKNGFQVEGILQKNIKKGSLLLDEYVLALIKK
jgi:ribosomal-protein-alanine N-acetyltransferase